MSLVVSYRDKNVLLVKKFLIELNVLLVKKFHVCEAECLPQSP